MTIAEAAAATGAVIRLRYTIHLDSGKDFPPGSPEDDLLFELGKDRLLPGIEKAVTGMRPGETKTVRVPSAEAYGPRRPERKFTIARPEEDFLSEPLRVGDAVRIRSSIEGDFPALIEEIGSTTILVDANHPLCGQDLTIDLDVLDVLPGPSEAILAGWP